MVGKHHEDTTRTALEILRASRDVGLPIIHASSQPDHFDDVHCDVPFAGPRGEIFGHPLTSFGHFQRAGNFGYCWKEDPSLSVLEELGDIGMNAAQMRVVGPTWGPMEKALSIQGTKFLCDFRFVPAAVNAEYYGGGYAVDLSKAGYALHYVQDACIPHHAWGALLFGHAAWELMAWTLWDEHRRMLRIASDPNLLERHFLPLVRGEVCTAKTVGGLVMENGEWARATFKTPRKLETCTLTEVLTVGARAVASSIAALRIMGVVPR